MNPLLAAALSTIRRVDRSFSRRSDRRSVLVDGHTPVNFVMVAPVFHAMAGDDRLQFFFTASENPSNRAHIYRHAGDVRVIHPRRAALMRFDAYVASDFLWATLPRGTRRIQMFHGVGGKYGFDAPTTSMRMWDRLFFVNARRLRNFIAAGAIDEDSPAVRMIGMPKVDCLVDGTFDRDSVLRSLALDPRSPVVLYAPTWSPASSLNAMGVELITGLLALGVNVIVKLHDRSRDLRTRYSGGIDWPARLAPLLKPGRAVLAPGYDISPYLVASDLMVTDHSSAGFEFLLMDRPVVRIHRPELIAAANIHRDYVDLLASVSETVHDASSAVAAVERGLADPARGSASRRDVANDLFHEPGGATARAVGALYETIELEPAALAFRGAQCPA
jgi:hypothetical protein